MSAAAVEEIDSSDNDYVDPSVEKYFKKTKGESKVKSKKKQEIVEESESDYEVEDEQEEEEEDDDDEPEKQQPESDEEEVQDKEQEDDGRTKVTIQMINKWSKKLSVSLIYHSIKPAI